MDNVLRKGELMCLCRSGILPKQWHSKYFILYGEAEKKQSRLDEFDKESTYNKDPTKRKTLFIEEVLDIETFDSAVKGQAHAFQITLQNKKKVLSADTEENKNDWVQYLKQAKNGTSSISYNSPSTDELLEDEIIDEENSIYEATPYPEYRVEVVGTDAAIRCNLPPTCIINITNTSVDILDIDSNKLHLWHFKCIRRYGRNKSSFTFECGRKSPTGPGTFVFATTEGEQIFRAVQLNLRTLKGSTDSLKDVSEVEGPCIPDRNYDQETYMELASAANSDMNKSDKSNSSVKSPPLLKPRSADAPTPPPRNENPFPQTDGSHIYSEPGDIISDGIDSNPQKEILYSEPNETGNPTKKETEKVIYQEVRKKIDENFYAQYDLNLCSKFDVVRSESPTESDKSSKKLENAQVYDNRNKLSSNGYDHIAISNSKSAADDSYGTADDLYAFIK